MAYVKRVRRAKRAVARRPVGRKTAGTRGRRRLQPVSAVAGAIGYAGYRAYRAYKGQKGKMAKMNAMRQAANLDVAKNIVSIPQCGLTIGSYQKPSLKEKIESITNEPIMFRQQHAYRVNGDSGRMNWFHVNILEGSCLQQYIGKLRESITDVCANPIIPAFINNVGVSDGPQEYYKMAVKYHSGQFQLMNSSTNSLKGVVMWVKPKRDSPALLTGTSIPLKPTNIFGLAVNASLPTTNVDNAANFTQGSFALSNLNLGYGRAGNVGTINNTADNVLETDVGLKPTSATVKGIFDYHFEVVKSTDFDLSPGQQAEFWFKMYNQSIYERQSIEYDNVKDMTYYCMIGFQGQMVGTSAITGDITAVSTGSAQLSIIETHKTIIKPLVTRAPKTWNWNPEGGLDTGILSQIADASQEIINDETDGVDNSYNETA